MFRVAIVGADDLNNYELFEQRCIYFLKNKGKEGGIIIHTTGEEDVIKFASKWHIEYKIFYTDWKHYGKEALKHRNHELLEGCGGVIVFRSDVKGNGMIRQAALDLNIPCRNVTT